jgi:hypothetical protein
LILEDIVGGGGRSANTSIQGPIVLNSGADLVKVLPGNPNPVTDQLNRVVYSIELGDLAAGTHTITYFWRVSDLGCYRYTTNEVHLDQRGVLGHLATSTISVMVNCTRPESATTGDSQASYDPGSPWLHAYAW